MNTESNSIKSQNMAQTIRLRNKHLKIKYPHVVLFLLLSIVFSSCAEPDLEFVFEDRWKIEKGDNIEYASKDFNDNDWKQYRTDIKNGDIFWVRFNTELPQWSDDEPKGIKVVNIGSYEAYWDGVLLGVSGELAHSGSEELAGPYIQHFLLPDSLSGPGSHVLALRSTNSYVEYFHSYFVVENYKGLITGSLQMIKYMFMVGGMFIMAALYFLFMFFNDPNKYSSLIISAVCLVFLALFFLEYCKHFYEYAYPFQHERLVYIGWLHVVLTILIPLFFVLEFRFPYKRFLFPALSIGILLIQIFVESYDVAAISQNRLMWIASLMIVLWACLERKKEAFIVLGGFLCSYFVFFFTRIIDVPYVSDFDIALFVSFIFILLSMIYVHNYRRKLERKAYEASLIVSERLKNELLKKNIKPHFIMNTLTSLIDWVEESPKDGVEFIHALAREFKVLNEMAERSLIDISQEIELCKSHLAVMGYRKEITYIWNQDNINPSDTIPPAILHTIVENGVTHTQPDENNQIQFYLSFDQLEKMKRYTLSVNASIDPSVKINSENVTIGTGSKYIKSRLQESYPNRWKYTSGPIASGWISIIEISDV